MNNKLAIRYLYYMCRVKCGTMEWENIYKSLHSFAESIGTDEYEKALNDLEAFDKNIGLI